MRDRTQGRGGTGAPGVLEAWSRDKEAGVKAEQAGALDSSTSNLGASLL